MYPGFVFSLVWIIVEQTSKSRQCISYFLNCCYYSSYILYLKQMVYQWKTKFQDSHLMLRYHKNTFWRGKESVKWFWNIFQNCLWAIKCIQEGLENQKSDVIGWKFTKFLPFTKTTESSLMPIMILYDFHERLHIFDS